MIRIKAKKTILVLMMLILSNLISYVGLSEADRHYDTNYGEVFRYGRAMILEHNGLKYDRPTLFYFGGQNERASIERSYKISSKAKVYENFNYICVSIYKDQNHSDVGIWRTVAKNIYTYLCERVSSGKINPSLIYLDGYSNGGAGAFYTALEIHGREIIDKDKKTNISVKKVTLIEGTFKNILKPWVIESFLKEGIELKLYVSETADIKISRFGREILAQYDGYDNFSGMLVDHGHGNEIVWLVCNSPYNSHIGDY